MRVPKPFTFATRAGGTPRFRLSGAFRRAARAASAGVMLVEVLLAVGVIGIAASVSIQALLMFNRNAAVARVANNAKEVVQRNMELALRQPLSSTSIPDGLVTTGTAGVKWNDTGGTTAVPLLLGRDGVTVLVSGTLSRTVSLWNAKDSTDNAITRRVTFRIDYTLMGRPMSYQLTSIRSPD